MTDGIRTVLVCGGAGFIGSHMARMLAEHGLRPVILDNLSTGHPEAAAPFPLIRADLLDSAALDAAFAMHKPDAVMHFAGKILVAESVSEPGLYYKNNVTATLHLLEAMRKAGVRRFVFSSSAAVYGLPRKERLTESHLLLPANPYGFTKLHVEQILAGYAAAHGLDSVCLRYFNAAGAHPDATLGESHSPESHLIPAMLLAALGRSPALEIFGDDYETPDGTCVRDYVHVQDLVSAHLLALTALGAAGTAPAARVYNLGSGRGFSVREVLHAAQQVAGRSIPHSIAPRRPGDPPYLVADSARARAELGWTPRYSDLEQILEHAWAWHRAQRY